MNICVYGGLITIMKKILALSLAALMALSVIGCSKKDDDTTGDDEGNKLQIVESTTTYENATFSYRVNDEGRYDITSVKYNGIEKIDIKLPSDIDGIAVTGIASEAFKANTAIESVEIPSSITKIGDWAFYQCISITEIKLPDSVKEIGKGAFWKCSGLSRLTLSSALTAIGDFAFMECTALESVTIPANVKTIGDSAFYGCSKISEMVIPASVEAIGRGAFLYCSALKTVTIENDAVVFPTKDVIAENGEPVKEPEGVFYACHTDLVIKAATESTTKAYVDAMNKGVTDNNKIDFESTDPTPAE